MQSTDLREHRADNHGLERGLGLLQATSLNIANMLGIGPFITIPAFIAAMAGPQDLVGWVAAAILVLCDGLVWSELAISNVAVSIAEPDCSRWLDLCAGDIKAVHPSAEPRRFCVRSRRFLWS